MRLTHRYPDRLVHLYIWRVLAWDGDPRGAEGQALQWLQPNGLMDAGLLPADTPIVARLSEDRAVNDSAQGNYAGVIV
jgi:8-oxo-dGTP diphosphatase